MPQKKTNASTTRKPTRKPASARRSTAAKPAGPAVELTHEMIARRAYEIWLTNITRAYQPTQDWAEAEKQLRAEMKKKPARAKAPAKKPEAAPAPALPQSNPETRLAA